MGTGRRPRQAIWRGRWAPPYRQRITGAPLRAQPSLCSFPLVGTDPSGALVQAGNGKFYGTTKFGWGSIFTVTPLGWARWQRAYAGLVMAADGNFYGTASSGGANNDGTVFRTPGIPATTASTHSSPQSPTSAHLTEAGRVLLPMRNHIWLGFINCASIRACFDRRGWDREYLLWQFTTGADMGAAPAVDSGVVSLRFRRQQCLCPDASTGAKLWQFATGNIVVSAPAVDNGVVYVSSVDANVYALNASTGAKLWQFTTGSGVESSPAVR